MPRIEYRNYNPTAETIGLIEICNQILEDYESQGYSLTLRQLYYQLVSRDIIENSQKSYNRVGSVISRAREGGLIDWEHIEDRTRTVERRPHWLDGKSFLEDVAPQFCLDLWAGQPKRVLVFVEKEALAQIVERACVPFDVPFLPNKGYLSASAVWNVAHNLMLSDASCDRWVVLHLGDHDPSGIDMSRDIHARLDLFASRYEDGHRHQDVQVVRLALNMDQVERFGPPPNPAKETDSRFVDYRRKFGDQSWELDALEPSVIEALIQDGITECLDQEMFLDRKAREAAIRTRLGELKLSGVE